MTNRTFFFKIKNNEPLVKLIIAPQEHMEEEYTEYREMYPDDAIYVKANENNDFSYCAQNAAVWQVIGNESDDPEWFNQVLTLLAPYRVTEEEACR